MPRNPHNPTPEQRQIVQLHATIGTPQDDIARVIGIDKKTLRKHYRDELDLAAAKANATIGGALFKKAKGYRDEVGNYHPPDTTAQIFWMKTRARWSERQEIDHTSSDGTMTPQQIILRAAKPDDNSDG